MAAKYVPSSDTGPHAQGRSAFTLSQQTAFSSVGELVQRFIDADLATLRASGPLSMQCRGAVLSIGQHSSSVPSPPEERGHGLRGTLSPLFTAPTRNVGQTTPHDESHAAILRGVDRCAISQLAFERSRRRSPLRRLPKYSEKGPAIALLVLALGVALAAPSRELRSSERVTPSTSCVKAAARARAWVRPDYLVPGATPT